MAGRSGIRRRTNLDAGGGPSHAVGCGADKLIEKSSGTDQSTSVLYADVRSAARVSRKRIPPFAFGARCESGLRTDGVHVRRERDSKLRICPDMTRCDRRDPKNPPRWNPARKGRLLDALRIHQSYGSEG